MDVGDFLVDVERVVDGFLLVEKKLIEGGLMYAERFAFDGLVMFGVEIRMGHLNAK